MYANIRGMRGKLNSLTEILHEHDPQMFILTETQLKSNTGTNIKGYTLYSRVRTNGSGGGVAILVRNDVKKHVAPHISDRNIELMWVSIRRKQQPPIFVGSYYGKQESRTSKEDIEKEMSSLHEEILEMKDEGEIFLAMDGNAKLGILGEIPSRNGKLLKQVFNNTNLTLMNSNSKCEGRVTRKNTVNDQEFSAIDFIVVSENVEKWINKIVIDEDGLSTIKGKKETDHNTIISTLSIGHIDRSSVVKHTNWNLRASSEKWAQFAEELEKRHDTAKNIIQRNDLSINERYSLWYRQIDEAARSTIGKTTTKVGGKEKFSKTVQDLCKEKKTLKKQISEQNDRSLKFDLISQYKAKQEQIKSQMVHEKTLQIETRFRKIIADKSRNAFWKEKKRISKNPVLQSLIIKDASGRRLFNPEEVKEGTASYYENLYKSIYFDPLPYHTEIKQKINIYNENREYETEAYNITPSMVEISEIIAGKQNGKSTTDLRNEMLKRPGSAMENMVGPLIQTIWKEETVPEIWNKGLVTSLWKGKGDKELLSNHRGITVSSALGSILEELIDHRIEQNVSLTPAQGGGKKKSSTFDHLFILRSLISVSLKQKRETYITFLDIKKAYDNVDNEDMLTIMWEKGLRGKAWRILKNLNTHLKAAIKTKYGTTRDIDMEIGGRQGSRVTGRMFAKLMDLLAEEVIASNDGIKMLEDFVIGILLWIDDVVSCVEGAQNQKEMLEKIDHFAKIHKLKWGQDKCKVMRIGKTQEQDTWKIGEMEIGTCESYTYLGDIITPDGKNTDNIKSRKNKITVSSVSINTIAASEILYKIETPVLLELHERVNVPSLVSNCESWTLLKSEEAEIEKAEIQCIKNLFDLPLKIPTPAIHFMLGIPYTNSRIDQKRLIYLHKILNRDPSHWTRRSLETLESLNIGWYKGIQQTLTKYNLPSDFPEIKDKALNEWKNIVKKSIEDQNKTRLINECHKFTDGIRTRKTKTAHIIDKIENPSYTRQPQEEFKHLSKQETKTLMIARFGMLECGKNFKGTMSKMCSVCCNIVDDEEHRLNICPKYNQHNYCENSDLVKFETIYSDNIDDIRLIISRIASVWNVKTGHGSMMTA